MKGLLRLLGIKKREEIVVVRVTKYRTLHDGYFNYLQYEKNGKWERIPKPYYSRWGALLLIVPICTYATYTTIGYLTLSKIGQI